MSTVYFQQSARTKWRRNSSGGGDATKRSLAIGGAFYIFFFFFTERVTWPWKQIWFISENTLTKIGVGDCIRNTPPRTTAGFAYPLNPPCRVRTRSARRIERNQKHSKYFEFSSNPYHRNGTADSPVLLGKSKDSQRAQDYLPDGSREFRKKRAPSAARDMVYLGNNYD